MTRVSCKSVRRVVETGNITIETYGSLQRVLYWFDVKRLVINGLIPPRFLHC